MNKLFVGQILFIFLTFTFSVQAGDTHTLLETSQHAKGFAGIVTREDGKLLVAAHPKVIKLFNPSTKKFEQDLFTLPLYSFPEDLALIPRDDSRGIPGGFSVASPLDGQIFTVLLDGTIIESNTGQFDTVPFSGDYNAQVDGTTFGINALAYRRSNDRLYAASSLVGNAIFRIDWRGSDPALGIVPLNIPKNAFLALNAFQFGPDDKLYTPDTLGGKILRINVDTGDVETLLSDIPSPIALKISLKGLVYFISQTTGEIFKYDTATVTKTKLATLEPPLDNLALSPDETKLYISSRNNKIFEVDVKSGSKKTLFSSALIQPWDIAYDNETDSLYIADTGSLKQLKAGSGKLVREIFLDSTHHPKLIGVGIISGIELEQGPGAKIILSDVTKGNTIVLNKKDLSVDTILNAFPDALNSPGQPFSAVRVNQGNTDFFLVADSVNGNIVRLNRDHSTSLFYSGLQVPIKLKIANGYLYIVEAGDITHFVEDSGRISRIPLNDPSPENLEILIQHLNNPQGLDIFGDKMVFLEVGKGELLEASSTGEVENFVLKKGLSFSNDLLLSPTYPMPIYPFAGVAIESNGGRVFLNQTSGPSIIQVDRAEILRKAKPKV